MLLHFRACISIIIVVVVLFYHDDLEKLWYRKTSNYETTFFVVGILSARENFAQREAARSTWLKHLSGEQNSEVKSWFIVGNQSCEIPPEHRQSVYGCEKWKINISGVQESFVTAAESGDGTCSTSSKKVFHQGFSFQVNYPVVVTKLGVHSRLLLGISPVKVAVMDIQSKDIVVQGVISSNRLTSLDGYIYTDVEAVLLPKNYEGLLMVEGILKEGECSDIVWNDGGGIITFKKVYSTPHHLDSKKYVPSFSVASSIGFYIPDVVGLKKIVAKEDLVRSQWLRHLEVINKRLSVEAAEKKDIVMVDVTDTYRSLPLKLLKFFKWLHFHYNYSYLLKTDDDCVVDIARLHGRLLEVAEFNSTRPCIWSKFRKDWPVNYVGKWADHDYKSSFYPSFPCGAAYVMSHQTVHWLSLNAEHLHSYQGEDVSIGIWLSAINPDFIEDENFECDVRCTAESYNRAQLSPSQVHEVWSFFKTCNNLCTCNNTPPIPDH